MITVKGVVDAMESIAPSETAEPWDRTGLLAGSFESKVRHIALALDATISAIHKSHKRHADMLIVHHPAFFHPPENATENTLSGARAVAAIQTGLALYASHTSLDIAPGGTNDVLAGIAGLMDAEIVQKTKTERLLKLAVFVPVGHEEKIIRVLGNAGAGAIGAYSHCTFRSKGIGTFRCGKDTRPFIGKPGSFEQTEEYRIETVFGEFLRDKIVTAMLKAHPYEEVAYDIWPVEGAASFLGFGRVGMLPGPESLSGLARRMAGACRSSMTQFHGRSDRRIQRAAVWAGAGAQAPLFAACGAEAVITGEVHYHDVEEFARLGIGLITLGHGFSEEPVLRPLAARLRKSLPEVRISVLSGTGFPMINV